MTRLICLFFHLYLAHSVKSGDVPVYPTGGILMQYTTTGLNYIIGMAEKATAKLMKDFPIPDTEGTGYAVSKVKVNNFDAPKYDAHFRNHKGVSVNVTIPKLNVSASYKVGYGVFGTSGNVQCLIQDLIVTMTIAVPRGHSGYPSIDLPDCGAKMRKFDLTFSEAGITGSVMNMLRGAMETLFTTSIGTVVCLAAKNTTRVIETVFFDLEKPIPELLSPNKTGPPASPDEMMNLTVICGPGQVQEKKGDKSIAENIMTNFVKEMDGLSVDLKMDQDAYFSDNDVVAGLRADFLYQKHPSGLKPPAYHFQPTTRGMCFAVGDTVINAFCLHGQQHNYFHLDTDLTLNDLAHEMHVQLKLQCPNCRFTFHVKSLEQPAVHFHKATGIQVQAKLDVEIIGRTTHLTKQIVNARIELDIDVNLRVEQNVVKGTLALKQTRINLNKVGLTGILNKPINDMLNRFVPKFIWPAVEKGFNKHMKDKGVKLPAYCGISFKNAQVINADGNVLICTDIVYDIDGFLDRFTKHQKEQEAKKLAATTPAPTTKKNWWGRL